MNTIPSYKKILAKNIKWFLLSLALFSVAFLIEKYKTIDLTPKGAKKVVENYIAEEEEWMRKEVMQPLKLLDLLSHKDISAEKYERENSGVFIYQSTKEAEKQLLFWNKNNIMPCKNDLNKTDGSWAVKYKNGYFAITKKTFLIDNYTYIVLGMIPIKWEFFIENQYLKQKFPANNNLASIYTVSFSSGVGIHNSEGKLLCYLSQLPMPKSIDFSFVSLLIKIISIFVFVLFSLFLATDVLKQRGKKQGIATFVFLLCIIKFFLLGFRAPFYFRDFELFSPSIYASRFAAHSLGDLFINLSLLLLFVKFVRYNYSAIQQRVFIVQKRWLLYGYLFFFHILLLLSVYVLKSLVIDANISFDVANFLSLDLYTLTAFIIITILLLINYNFAYLIFSLKPLRAIPLWKKLLFSAFLLFLYNISPFVANTVSINIRITLWILFFVALSHFLFKSIRLQMSRRLILVVFAFFYMISVTSLLRNTDLFVDFKVKKIASTIIEKSIAGDKDNLLRNFLRTIDSNFLKQNFYRFYQQRDNQKLRDSLESHLFSSYADSYNTKLLIFDSSGIPLSNSVDFPLKKLDEMLAESIDEGGEGMFFTQQLDWGNNYFYLPPMPTAKGKLCIILEPRERGLLQSNHFDDLLEGTSFELLNNQYNYAVYKNNKLLYSNAINDFAPKIKDVENLVIGKTQKVLLNKEKRQYTYVYDKNIVVVLSEKKSDFFIFYTIFSYLITICIILVFIIDVLSLLVVSNFSVWALFRTPKSLSLVEQLYWSILFVSLLFFLMLSVSVVSFHAIEREKENTRLLVEIAELVRTEIEEDMAIKAKKLSADNIPYTYEHTLDIVQSLSNIYRENISFYNQQGNLLHATKPYIYNEQISSTLLNPLAKEALNKSDDATLVYKEWLGGLSYLNAYNVVKDSFGQIVGYVSIPFYSSEKKLVGSINAIITTIVNLVAFIFLLAGVLSFVFSRRFVSSFVLIKEKMKKINVKGGNEEIVWDRDDEIGALIVEYNKMVKKLEQSFVELAKTERAVAWQEMSRQVAHEIKNPLTPMKLNIQFLQMMDKGNERAQAIYKLLIEQIDQLALIANDFLHLSNIDNIKSDYFSVTQAIQSVVDLHATNTSVVISYDNEAPDVYMYFDETKLRRVFTNLIKNAIEATEALEHRNVIVRSTLENDTTLFIAFTDNGIGIPKEKHDNIFQPNFTTKSSGTGLGLAICKAIIEKAHGKIWFQSEENKGTTFFITIPIVKKS